MGVISPRGAINRGQDRAKCWLAGWLSSFDNLKSGFLNHQPLKCYVLNFILQRNSYFIERKKRKSSKELDGESSSVCNIKAPD